MDDNLKKMAAEIRSANGSPLFGKAKAKIAPIGEYEKLHDHHYDCIYMLNDFIRDYMVSDNLRRDDIERMRRMIRILAYMEDGWSDSYTDTYDALMKLEEELTE